MDDEPMWAADRVVAPTPDFAITILETANKFAIKGNHWTLVKGNQFDGKTKTDPHKHIHEFLGIYDMFKYRDTKNEVVRLMMFPLSLTEEAKTWLDELNEGTIETWDELQTAFISRFFPRLFSADSSKKSESLLGLILYRTPWPIKGVLRKNTENLNTKISKLNEELSDCETDLYNYKRGFSQVEARLVEFKENKVKFYERIRVLDRDVEIRDNKIEYLKNELEQVKKEKESLDNKLTGFGNASKDLDNLLGSQRSDKKKEGLGYSAVPPPLTQIYSPLKKDLSWTGLPEFINDTVTDYRRPTPSIDASKCNKSELQSSNFSVFEHGESTGSIMHMTGNISYLSEYEPYDGGYVSFGHGGGKITGKGIIKTDEHASLSRDDRHEEAFPTVSNLYAGQDRENIAMTSAMSHESSPRVLSLDADKDNKIKDQDIKISGLKARVKSLEDKERRREEPIQEDAPITRGIINIREELGADKSTKKGSKETEEKVNALSSMETANILSSGGTAFSTTSVSSADVFRTAGVPTVSAIFTTAGVATPYTIRSRVYKRQGKGALVDLKRLFEPDSKDQLWTYHQAFIHDPLDYKLYDTCSLHHVSTKKNQEIFIIDEILEEDFDALLDEGSKILHSIKGTLLEEEIFSEFNEFITMIADENSEFEFDTEEPPFKKITINTDYKIKTSLEEPPTYLELKPLPNKLKYISWKNHLFSLRMPFGLFNAPATFQRCMLAVFHDVIEDSIKAWEKCHSMVKEGIVLGHKVSSAGLEVDKSKIGVISKLTPINIK
nr:reverse transcriptase domain-containing protein [Tanacetum cinerariifolium]